MNVFNLIGNVGGDPETRSFESGSKLVEFSVAENRKFKGETLTNWFRCKAWGQKAELIEKYVSKGDKVAISGRIEIRKDDQGRYWTDVIVNQIEFLGRRATDDAASSTGDKVAAPSDDLPW